MKWVLVFLMLGLSAQAEPVIYREEPLSQVKILKYENIFFKQSLVNTYKLGFKLLPPPLVSSEAFRAVVKKDCEAFAALLPFYNGQNSSFEQDRHEPLAYTMKTSYEIFLELSELNFQIDFVDPIFINFETISGLQVSSQKDSFSELVKRRSLKAAQFELVSEHGLKALKITDRDLACDLINRPLQVELLQHLVAGLQPAFKQNVNRLLKQTELTVAGILKKRISTGSKLQAAQLGFRISILLEEHLPEKNRPQIRNFWSSVFKENSLNFSEPDFSDQTFLITGRLYEIQ